MSTDPHLDVRELACGLGKRTILNAVNLRVEPGQMVALVGPNGAGKSTLLRTLAGLLSIHTGSITIHGQSLPTMGTLQRARQLAFVGQKEEPPSDLTVAEVVALGLLPHRLPWSGGGKDEQVAVEQALAHVHMTAYAKRAFHQLSGGEQRRVLLARGLAQRTPLLFLDEPTNHLDIRHQHLLLSMVCTLKQTVVAAIHDLDLAVLYFDHVLVLYNGGVYASGKPEAVLTPECLKTVFGVEATWVSDPISQRKRLLLSYRK